MQKVRVVVATTDQAFIPIINTQFEKAGYTVAGFVDSLAQAQAFLTVEEADIALIAPDLGAPEEGIRLAELINEQFHLPFIFIVDDRMPGTHKQFQHTRPGGILHLPFTFRTLQHTIEIALFNFANSSYPIQWELEIVNSQLPSSLTEQELELLQDIFDGLTNMQISRSRGISVARIKFQLQNVYKKLHVLNRPEAISAVQQYLQVEY
ncbi:MAG: LuxR C-terminal-related transcriptional regulator [Bacteroidota bacterium]